MSHNEGHCGAHGRVFWQESFPPVQLTDGSPDVGKAQIYSSVSYPFTVQLTLQLKTKLFLLFVFLPYQF